MALINCPECGKEVSTTALSCPHCGYALLAKAQHKKNSSFYIISIIFCIIVITALLFIPKGNRSGLPEDFYNIGLEALSTVDDCLSVKVPPEDARNSIAELSNQLEFAATKYQDGDSESLDLRIALTDCSVALLSLSHDPNEASWDDLKKARKSLAGILKVK